MSSAKVTSGAPVGHTTSVVKLNGVRAASPASVSASISAVNDSTNIGSATEQYLPGGDDSPVFVPKQDSQETSVSIPYSALNGEMSTEIQLQFQENTFLSFLFRKWKNVLKHTNARSNNPKIP